MLRHVIRKLVKIQRKKIFTHNNHTSYHISNIRRMKCKGERCELAAKYAFAFPSKECNPSFVDD